MNFQDNFAYHIKDEYFRLVQDDKLMSNKEAGSYRPTFICIQDPKTNLLWAIPMSTRVEKYQNIVEKQIERYGECLSIVIGKYDGKQSAFLLQNMFPITKNYIAHVHTRKNNPVPVNYSIRMQVLKKFSKLLQLHKLGKKVVFPDIDRLVKIMIEKDTKERNKDNDLSR